MQWSQFSLLADLLALTLSFAAGAAGSSPNCFPAAPRSAIPMWIDLTRAMFRNGITRGASLGDPDTMATPWPRAVPSDSELVAFAALSSTVRIATAELLGDSHFARRISPAHPNEEPFTKSQPLAQNDFPTPAPILDSNASDTSSPRGREKAPFEGSDSHVPTSLVMPEKGPGVIGSASSAQRSMRSHMHFMINGAIKELPSGFAKRVIIRNRKAATIRENHRAAPQR
jgi:hypothetical protein